MKPEGNEELVNYRIKKARETFNEVDILIKNKLWNTAINRLYYSCFYAVTALLADNDIETHSHAGARQMLGLHFVRTGLIEQESGRFYTRIFDLRQTGDYDDFIDFDEPRVLELLEPADKLITQIEKSILRK